MDDGGDHDHGDDDGDYGDEGGDFDPAQAFAAFA